MRTSKKSSDIYQIITDKIIQKLEAGLIPWKQPWHHQSMPTNYLTKKPYRGMNLLLLGMNGFPQPYYLTFKQAQQLGGHVKKGAKSEIVVFWQMRYYVAGNPDGSRKQWVNFSHQTSLPDGSKVVPLLRYYRVFNIQDIDGIAWELAEQPSVHDDLALDDLETGYLPLRAIPGLTLVTHSDKACYSPLKDTIYMPTINDFETTSGYFEVLYHELCHSTGHYSRLARQGITDPIQKRSERYAKEELIAELGSCFLMQHVGFQREETLDNSAAYIQSWLEHLRNDHKLIVQAAGKAQQAVDYITACIAQYQPRVGEGDAA